MSFFPIFLKTKGQTALVVGAGEIALRKIRLLKNAGFRIKVVALDIDPAIPELLNEHDEVHNRAVIQNDTQGVQLVIAATENMDVNKDIYSWATDLNIPVNVVDQPELCTYITPAIVDRSPLVIAISSGGESPVLARQMRAKLEAFIPAGYGLLAGLLSQFRQKVKKTFPSIQTRRLFWEDVLESPVTEACLHGQDALAEKLLEEQIDAHSKEAHKPKGEVYVVGAGPGDPDLLTFRALRLMQKADVVLYDRLVSPALLELCRRDAERLYVGKARAHHAVPQDQINAKLVELAKQGKKVCRLKGGDPFIFGRGGEEIAELMAADIPFQVVPAVTAAAGCAAYAGIPLTHRDYAQSVSFVTGHLSEKSLPVEWARYVKPFHTLVIYMGKPKLRYTLESLVSAGMSPDMPIALVSKGTMPDQKVLEATVSTMADMVENTELEAPTLVIIGEVVKLRSSLNWFKKDEN
ncbi:MAG TPA: uroporphyrinogen-III C-methyltransferase [Gammaproteobacteria bacterium]|nr:uroporphyrinogen-III C-methyltransferase [Gammaproteobacteria bacterium]HCK92228.1 uroporphyrinogen-III C-methyltransferase [Gammaproteobacteria bacterium]